MSAIIKVLEPVDVAYTKEARIVGAGRQRNPWTKGELEDVLVFREALLRRLSLNATMTTDAGELGLNTSFQPVVLTKEMVEPLHGGLRGKTAGFYAEATPGRRFGVLNALNELEFVLICLSRARR